MTVIDWMWWWSAEQPNTNEVEPSHSKEFWQVKLIKPENVKMETFYSGWANWGTVQRFVQRHMRPYPLVVWNWEQVIEQVIEKILLYADSFCSSTCKKSRACDEVPRCH